MKRLRYFFDILSAGSCAALAFFLGSRKFTADLNSFLRAIGAVLLLVLCGLFYRDGFRLGRELYRENIKRQEESVIPLSLGLESKRQNPEQNVPTNER